MDVTRHIKPYHNKFRAYVVDSEGKHHQKYFDSEILAEQFIRKYRPVAIGNAKYKKRSTASSDLPVGLHEIIRSRKLVHGEVKTPTIIATVVINGKAKTKSAAFGRKRTKEKAIEICKEWRIKQLAEIPN